MIYRMSFGEIDSKDHYWADPVHNPSFSFGKVLAGISKIPSDVALKYRSMKGDTLQDFMCGSDEVPLISKKMANALVNANFTGFDLLDVTIESKGLSNNEYAVFITNNTAKFVDDQDYGKVDPSTMHCDFATPIGTGVIVCTEETKTFIEEHCSEESGMAFKEFEKRKLRF